MNCRFVGGPLDRTVCYIAPAPATIAAEGGGHYCLAEPGVYNFHPGPAPAPHTPTAAGDGPGVEPTVEAPDPEVVHLRPARRRTTTRRKRST